MLALGDMNFKRQLAMRETKNQGKRFLGEKKLEQTDLHSQDSGIPGIPGYPGFPEFIGSRDSGNHAILKILGNPKVPAIQRSRELQESRDSQES